MDLKFVVVCVFTIILLPKNCISKNITQKCFLNVKTLYDQIINKNISFSYYNNYKNFTLKLEALQNDTNKLNVMAIFEKLESIYKINKPSVNFLEKQRLVLHSKLKSNEENLNVLDSLLIEAQEKLLNATELENIINVHDKELKIISKEAQHVLNDVENLVILIISINETYDTTKLVVKNLHDNKTEIENLLKNITDLNVTNKINATKNKNNKTIAEIIELDNEINGVQMPELPKIDKCDSFESELIDLVNKQSKFLSEIEETTKNVTYLQKNIRETHSNLRFFEERADLAVKEINEILSVIKDFKNGLNNATTNVTNEIERKLAEISAQIEEIIKKADDANATLTIVANDTEFLENKTNNFSTLTENVTDEYQNFFDELGELNSSLFGVDFLNEIKLDETKLSLADLEVKYEKFDDNFREFLEQYDDLYKKRKNELKEINGVLRENENSLQILKEYVAILDHFDFSDAKLDELEEEIRNGEKILEIFKEKERLEGEVEIVRKIYEGLPAVGKKYCKNIEIEPIAETERK